MNGLRKFPCLTKIGMRCFAPHQVCIWRIGEATRDCLLQTILDPVESLVRSSSNNKSHVATVNIACYEVSRVCIGAGHKDRGNIHDVCSQPGSNKLVDCLTCRHQYFATH